MLSRGALGTLSWLLLTLSPTAIRAQSQPGMLLNQGPIVIENVRLFDGIKPQLLDKASVLIDFARTEPQRDSLGRLEKGQDIGYFIREISTSGHFMTPFSRSNSRRIDGKGLVLMPGLIDNHVHLSWANGKPMFAFGQRIQQGKARFEDFIREVGVPASLAEAKSMLMHGFTSVREVGGVAYLARPKIDPAIDRSDPQRNRLRLGQPGSRIWQAGAVISATGGHADMAADFEPDGQGLNLLPESLDAMSVEELEELSHRLDRIGARLADGVPEVQKAVREQFVKKANFIKITTGGGVMSPHDPIDIRTWSAEEVKAAVDVADGYNTYVTSHNYLGQHIIRDIHAGVRMFEHANLLNESAAQLIGKRQHDREKDGKDRSIWLSITPFFSNQYSNPAQGVNREKQKLTHAGTTKAYAYAKKYNISNLGYGSDVLFSPDGGAFKSLKMLASLPKDLAPLKSFKDLDNRSRDFSYSLFEVIRMATANNGRILTMSGPRTSYNGVDNTPLKPGAIGVIQPNAVADLILVRGNPLTSLDFFNYSNNIILVMKDGTIYKNLLNERSNASTPSIAR